MPSKLFLMSLIYLNNAATSWPKPQRVKDVLSKSLDLPVFGSGRTTGTQGIDYISLAREKAADAVLEIAKNAASRLNSA